MAVSVIKSNADYIVEQGTSGNWTYRKWASGVSECWGRFERTATSWTQWGSLYIANPYNTQETYPTGLFTQTPKATAEIMACSQDMFLSVGFTPAGSSTNTPAYYGARGSSGSANATYSIAIYAIGKWQ